MDEKKLKTHLQEHPTAYAGLRALKISSKGRERTIAESDEVPFIFSILFTPLIFGYIVWKRSKHVARSALGLVDPTTAARPDHIFVMTSDHEYRTYAFEEVGARLRTRGENVMFVCSPDSTEQMDEWADAGFCTESFPQLLRFVPIHVFLARVLRSAVLLYTTRNLLGDYVDGYSRRYVFNSILLENIKELSMRDLASDDPRIHTYSLMPYHVKSTATDNLYVYQHGVQRRPEKDTWTGTWAFPSNVLIWGEAWIDNYERLVHPESNIHVVGSPWHEHLANSKTSGTDATDWDVVFICGSQVTTHSQARADAYEELVADLVECCEENDWSLAFKLHPVEDPEWYRDRGWAEYIVEFEGINDALGDAEIAVSQFSSAFVESIVLGTLMILDEAWSSGLEEVRPIAGVSFIDITDLESEIEALLTSERSAESLIETNRLVDIGGSTSRIVALTSGVDSPEH